MVRDFIKTMMMQRIDYGSILILLPLYHPAYFDSAFFSSVHDFTNPIEKPG